MKIHHAYIGLFLILWSLLAIFFNLDAIRKYNPNLVWLVLALGIILFVHDAYWHLTHKKH
jgi:vacuolar-type H+-ATPase subunit I/STV1